MGLAQVLGHTLVTIAGSGFRRAFNHLCRWDQRTTNITSLNATHVVCPTPETAAGASVVEVSLNGQQFSADAHSFSHCGLRRGQTAKPAATK